MQKSRNYSLKKTQIIHPLWIVFRFVSILFPFFRSLLLFYNLIHSAFLNEIKRFHLTLVPLRFVLFSSVDLCLVLLCFVLCSALDMFHSIYARFALTCWLTSRSLVCVCVCVGILFFASVFIFIFHLCDLIILYECDSYVLRCLFYARFFFFSRLQISTWTTKIILNPFLTVWT